MLDIDLDFGLGDILTKKHFWKTMMAFSILVCASIIADQVFHPGTWNITNNAVMVWLGTFMLYGYAVLMKRHAEKKAELLNNQAVELVDIQALERLEEKYSDKILDFKPEQLRAAREKKITWRDLLF